MAKEEELVPLHVFRFRVDFVEDSLTGRATNKAAPVCSGAFSECTGLEATMEPKVIKEGGHNYGANQRAGPVTFATVVLKRGMTTTRHLFKWFELVSNGAYAYRLAATITMMDGTGKPVVTWKLARCLPVKFKTADMNAKSAEVGIEELHLAHEGLSVG